MPHQPLRKEDAMKVIERRIGKVKILCVFCERRIGWYFPEEITKMISQHHLTMCEICKPFYSNMLSEFIAYHRTRFNNPPHIDKYTSR